jgi:serine/threonine protein kinase
LDFSLKNGKYSYNFSTKSAEEKQEWIDWLLKVNKTRDIQKDYKILDKVIGKGAYGKVKLAHNLETDEIVAVKIISKEPLDNRSATRLRREISILKICKHENIVALKDIYETIDKYYIVTEYVQGGSLFVWIKQRGFRVSEEIAKDIIRQIALAVDYLHSLGIVHRDIKLENILLDTSAGIKPKIIDFGLSCILGPGQHSQEAVGTLKYASPELISRIPYRETPDVWGIGVILYILLTGKIPFYGENDQEIANRILKKKIDLDNERWAGISKEAKDVVLRLLTRKANERIKICELVAHDWFKERDDKSNEL